MSDYDKQLVGGNDEVDLFELSHQIKQTERIHRSVEEDYYQPTHVRGAASGQPQTAEGRQTNSAAGAVSRSRQAKAPAPSVQRTSAAPTVSVRPVPKQSAAAVPAKTGKSTHSPTKQSQKRNTAAASSININQFVKFLLIMAGICVIMGAVLFNHAVGGMNYVEIDTDWSDVKAETAPNWALRSEPEVTNILLLGIDGDGGDNQRSDTIMILTLDGKNDVMKMTSILRDTYVFIPGRESKTRINHAYAYGGAGLTMRTVESNFRIDLERYIGIDMDGLTVVADKLGGVEIELTKAEANTINKHVKNSELTEGLQHLNGAQATYYARIRKLDSDFGRTSRQRKLIRAMLAQFKELNVVEQYSLVSETTPYLTTNYSKSELMAIALKAMGMLDADMEEMSVPVQGSYQSQTISGMAVLVPDIDQNCRALHQFIFGSLPE